MKQTLKKLSVVSLLIVLLFTITPITSIATDKLPPSKNPFTEEELSTSIEDAPLSQSDNTARFFPLNQGEE